MKIDIYEKMEILSNSAKYDVSCSSSGVETNFKKVNSVAGATVKGDGSIGIIIDVKSILEKF